MKTALAQLVFSLFLGASGLKVVVESETSYVPETDDYVAELQKCYKEEDELLERQRRERERWGIFGDIVDAGCAFSLIQQGKPSIERVDLDGQHGLLQVEDNQTLQSNEGIIGMIFGGGCAAAQGAMGLADGFVEREHERQNLAGTDCNRMAAYATQMKLAKIDKAVTEGFNKVGSQLKSIETKMDANHQQIAATLSHMAKLQKANQFKVQEMIQSEVGGAQLLVLLCWWCL